MLWYALDLFEKCPEVEGTIVVVAEEARPRVGELTSPCAKVAAVVAGGARRQDSCWAGLQAAAARANLDAKVLIHDAARPLADAAMLARILGALERADGVVPTIALADTVKEVDGEGRVVATPARERFRAVQTPQGFRLGAIIAAYRQARAHGWEVTDDATVLELSGGSVSAVAGDRRNLKVTYPEDLALAAAMLAASP